MQLLKDDFCVPGTCLTMFIATLNLTLSSTLLFEAADDADEVDVAVAVVVKVNDGAEGITTLLGTDGDDSSNKMSSKLGTLTFCKKLKGYKISSTSNTFIL